MYTKLTLKLARELHVAQYLEPIYSELHTGLLPSEVIKLSRIKNIDQHYAFMVTKHFMPREDQCLFAIWMVNQIANYLDNEIYVKSIEQSELYIYGSISREELKNTFYIADEFYYQDVDKTSSGLIKKAKCIVHYLGNLVYLDIPFFLGSIYSKFEALKVAEVSPGVWKSGPNGEPINDEELDIKNKYFEACRREEKFLIDKILDYFLVVESGQKYNWKI